VATCQIEVGGVPTEGVHAYVRAEEGDSVDIRARMMFGGIGKKNATFLSRFYIKNEHFTKTGSGQT
jgi:hypothetical protein